MRLPVVGFSRVHKPTSWFALHFIHERGAYLVLEHKDNKPLPIYRNIKCLAGFYVKPQHITLYRFSTSNHNLLKSLKDLRKLYYIVSLHQTTTARIVHGPRAGCIISFLYIKPQPNSGDSWEVPVVLYRFSTSNHNHSCTPLSCCIISFLYIKPQRCT